MASGMFSTVNMGSSSHQVNRHRTVGTLRLQMPTTVKRCQRRLNRVATGTLEMPEVELWPLLDPKSVVVAERACRLGFDVFVTTDDMAFNTGPFFSPKVLRELVMPRFRRLAEVVTLPWVLHSDGNIMPFLPDLLELGIAGLHPLEKGAMDVAAVKREYGDRICLLGNVDLNILGMGSEEDVVREVRELIRVAGPGGGRLASFATESAWNRSTSARPAPWPPALQSRHRSPQRRFRFRKAAATPGSDPEGRRPVFQNLEKCA